MISWITVVSLFLRSLIYRVISVWASAVYAKYVSTPILSVKFPQKISPKETRIPVVHFNSFRFVSHISLFPDLLCSIGLSVSSNFYVWKWYLLISRIRGGIPIFLCSLIYCVTPVWVSVVYAKYAIILDWYRYVSLSPDLLCNICLRKTSWCVNIRLNGYTLHWVSTKNQLTKKPGFPLSAYILLAWGNIDALCNRTETGRRLETTKVKMAEI